jgi:hypothetical protein
LRGGRCGTQGRQEDQARWDHRPNVASTAPWVESLARRR